MKKFFMMMALSIFAFTMNAQNETAVKTSKFFDDWYVGINGGVMTKTSHSEILGNLNPTFGVRVGKNVTPVIGFVVEGTSFSGLKPFTVTQDKVIKVSNVSFLGTFNVTNFFLGYNGEPRFFEIVGIAGLGWLHNYTNINAMNADVSKFGTIQSYPSLYDSGVGIQTVIPNKSDMLSSKMAIDFTFNVGKDKAWQVFAEPSIVYAMNPHSSNIKFNVNNSVLNLNVGVMYKFKNSHNTHNFVIGKLLDEAAWYNMNTELNSLRSANAQLTNTVNTQAQVIKSLTEQISNAKVGDKIEIGTAIGFKINSSKIDNLQLGSLNLIAKALKENPNKQITVVGYADKKTGTASYNQKLSLERANSVKKVLVALGADERQILTKGEGSKQSVFEQNDWNRTAIFVSGE